MTEDKTAEAALKRVRLKEYFRQVNDFREALLGFGQALAKSYPPKPLDEQNGQR